MRLKSLLGALRFVFILCSILLLSVAAKAQLTCDFDFIGQTTGCCPLLMKARQTVPPTGITVRDWDILDQNGNVVTNFAPNTDVNNDSLQYIFCTPGTYSLRLTATNSGGQVCTVTKPGIVIYAKPSGNFTFNITEGCSPLALQVQCNYQSNCPTPGTLTIDWGGGGAPYTNVGCPAGGIINKVYNAPPGYYSPKFILVNGCGCDTTIVYDSLIRIIPKPVASFTANVTTANCSSSPLNVTFTANNAGPNMTYEWFEGTTPIGTGMTLTRAFPLSNLCYTIKLKVVHSSGGACADSMVRTNYICNRPQPNINFFQNITTGCVDAQTPANLILSNDPNDGLSSLTWYLSGGTPLQTFPVKVADIASYSITVPGTYTVTAIGSFGPGCNDTIIQQVFVANVKPVANFSVNDTFGCSLPHNVVYTANTSSCNGCVFNWTTTGGSPNSGLGNTFATSYNTFSLNCRPMTLRVTASNGCMDTLTNASAVCVKRLSPRIGMNRSKGCAPLCVNFTNATVLTAIPDPIASTCWSFPGSSFPSSCVTPLTNCFTAPGCYDVRLELTTTTGCVDTVLLVDTICVGQPPSCTMTASPLNYCYEADTTCFAISCGSSTFDFVRCDYGDGVIESVTTSAWCHYYQDTGQFNSRCIVFSDSCAGDTFNFVTNIYPPIAAFTTTSGCSGSSGVVSLINNSEGATSFLWNFCDGTTSTQTSPTVNLPPCSACEVTLTANGPLGCTHQATQIINAPCGNVAMSPSDTVVCAGRAITYTNASTSITPNATRWDFNINNGLNFNNINGSGETVTTGVFSTPGVFTVSMLNVSGNGCRDTVYGTYTVCDIIPNFGPTSVCLPLPICLQNQTVDSLCSGLTYKWTFSDNPGYSDTARNPCYTFSTPGSYQVKLIVTNQLGCRDSITKTVVAATPVDLNYTVDTLLCPGSQSCVVNNSQGAPGIPLTYNWSMPNSNIGSSTSASPCFTYTTEGDYPVYLQIASGSQCTVYDTFTVSYRSPIASGYISQDTILCPQPPVPIQFTSTSMYYDSTLTWSFGNANNNQSNFANATFFYDEPGTYFVRLRVRTKDGCVSTEFIDTVVVKGPYGTFTASPSGMCSCKDTITLTVSTVDATSLTMLYGCNLGGPSTSISPIGTSSNPTSINFPINYCVTDTCKPQLIFADNAGCQVYFEQPIIPIDSPEVKFSFDNYGVCVNGVVCFEDTTVYHIASNLSYTVKRVWDFGDNSADRIDSSNNPTPCHYYDNPGGYTTKLYVWSNLGCFDSIVSTVVVVPEFPVAGFYADDSLVCATVPMCFHDTSYIYPLTGADYWVWYWGDGKVDTANTPDFCHAYDAGGYYRVTMCVYDSVGCPDCDSSVVIRVIDNPVANAGGDRNVCYGIPTQLNGSGGTAVHWEPAGIMSNPDIYNPIVQLFNDTSVIIMVGDTFGCVDDDTARLSISRVFADFNVGTDFCRDDSVCVTDASTNINGTLTTWFYDFGAGDTINDGASPCYFYPSSGVFNIVQLVVDNNGCVDTASRSINILPSPDANFVLNDTIICSNQQLCVTDSSNSQSAIQSWTWNYGTGNVATGQSQPCRLYTPPFASTYPVSLIVEDQNGCSDTAVIVVTVNEVPQANFTWSVACETDSMPLANTSVQGDGVIMNCEWTLWLGAPSPVLDNSCNTKFRFTAGSYPVQLVVTDINGCADTIVRTVVTDSISRLSIFPGDTAICVGTSVEYTVGGVFDNLVWQPEIWIDNPSSATVIITPEANISYRISATNGVCASAVDTFSIRTIQKMPLEVDAAPQQIVLGLSSNITSQVAGTIDSIIWSPDLTLDCRSCPNPIATPTGTTTYTATIYYSEQGTTCITDDSITIEVLNSCENSVIFVPNTFTPNGDGLNEVFLIRGIAATKIKHFRVFDRWGQMVFGIENGEANEVRWGWDGTNRNGEKLNSAVYVYTYEIECINGETVSGKGNVTLVR